MIPNSELNRRAILRSTKSLERVQESMEHFLKRKKLTQCKTRKTGYWYKMKYGMQFRRGCEI